MIRFETTLGDFTVELFEKEAPESVANFLRYIDEGFFDGTIFHRIVPGFVIQGGGFTEDMTQKKTKPPVKNEADNGLKNKRGTLSMARTNDINSATSQFFVNLKDNDFLDHSRGNFGYAVFAQVTDGMDVVDKIAAVETGRKRGFDDVPVEAVIMKSVRRAASLTGRGEKEIILRPAGVGDPRVARDLHCGQRSCRGAAALDQSALQRVHGRSAARGLGEARLATTCFATAGWTWIKFRPICRSPWSPRKIRNFPSTGASMSRPSKRPTR